MPLTIPNSADAGFAPQADPDSKDVDVLVAGFARTGVQSGCAVTAQGTPDMTLAVAAGVVEVAGITAAVTAGNVTITTAHATNPRFDLVVASSAGALSVTAGTAAAAPVFPAIPANSVVLAAVYVPANDTAINTNQITDKRVMLWLPSSVLAAFQTDVTVVNTVTETDLVSLTLPGGMVAAGDLVRVNADVSLINNSGAALTYTWRLKFGATTILNSGPLSVASSTNRSTRNLSVHLFIESTTAQEVTASLPATAATAAGTWGTITAAQTLVGRGTTAENTATDKAIKFTVAMGTAHALAEAVAHSGTLELIRKR